MPYVNSGTEKKFLGFIKFTQNPAVITFEVKGESGAEYQVEIQAWWDDKKDEDIRVSFNIDDGRLSAYMPLSDDFIVKREK